ncbi:hypothetical protein BDV98DRAFT_512173 [Pterulicium gracile]|uniref:MADS-box domain-containing protein n=1 Tax=Pterulicium gracile TaxID=1884261 RepID=A0A5C3Q9U7_9AGAR|nr:hypothetical protein BDV98DRAFT_512173 [Pterula gracilis]
MGRRKIEIQPIKHERNRSVTFLKRKNGLFKKAYELGVLCSVDVAVIIFENKPSNGHHVKLHQYCSTDIHDVVQRHMRHDGEKDSRSPGDFSGEGGGKGDDGGDGDEEEGDEEEVQQEPATSSRGGGNQKRQRTEDKPVGKNTSGLSPDDAPSMNIDVCAFSFSNLLC